MEISALVNITPQSRRSQSHVLYMETQLLTTGRGVLRVLLWPEPGWVARSGANSIRYGRSVVTDGKENILAYITCAFKAIEKKYALHKLG